MGGNQVLVNGLAESVPLPKNSSKPRPLQRPTNHHPRVEMSREPRGLNNHASPIRLRQYWNHRAKQKILPEVTHMSRGKIRILLMRRGTNRMRVFKKKLQRSPLKVIMKTKMLNKMAAHPTSLMAATPRTISRINLVVQILSLRMMTMIMITRMMTFPEKMMMRRRRTMMTLNAEIVPRQNKLPPQCQIAPGTPFQGNPTFQELARTPGTNGVVKSTLDSSKVPMRLQTGIGSRGASQYLSRSSSVRDTLPRIGTSRSRRSAFGSQHDLASISARLKRSGDSRREFGLTREFTFTGYDIMADGNEFGISFFITFSAMLRLSYK